MSDVWTPPQAEVKDLGISGNPDAPEIRRKHLSHEANIKAIGALYYLGAIVLTLSGAATLIGSLAGKAGAQGVIMSVLFIGIGVLYFWLGHGLRALKSRVKIPAGVLAGIGLLGFPVGTLINVFVLYLLFSQKGSMVFSDEYKQIIADTPDIKYRTSIIVWIFLALLLGLTVAAVIAGRS